VFVKLLGEHDPEHFDWFFYPRNEVASEDGAFSREAEAAGFRLGATTHVKAGHISRLTTGWDTYQEYLQLSGSNQVIESYQAMLRLISQYTGEDVDLVQSRVMRGSKNVRDAWRGAESGEQARAFYRDDGWTYLYDLTAWNYSDLYTSLTAPLKAYQGKRVLVVGAGIGGEIERLVDANQVEAFELSTTLRDFCRMRFGDRITWIEGESIISSRLNRSYDLIVMIDVVEHIHPDEFDNTMDTLAHWLAPGGEFYIHANFGQQELYPMHYDHTERFAAWLKRNRLERKGESCVYS
jgi:2-polyprenyl-3-methyl-5-hydroxy-6-metoxy-1,4-benzoquinol methylase